MGLRWVAVAVLALLASPAAARTLHVPAEVSTIRRAVFEAAEGDTVLVAPGTYRERFTIRDKNIVLRSELGAGSTTIDGSIGVGNVVSVGSTTQGLVDRRTLIEGFTIVGGSFNAAAPESTGAAIYVNRSHPTIRGCTLTLNDGNAVGGVAVYFFSHPRIQDCWIGYNQGGGIFVETDTGLPGPAAEIVNSFVVRNRGYGISVIKGGRAVIENTTVAYNAGDGVRGEITQGIGQGFCYVTVRRSIVSHNLGGGIVQRLTGRVCYTLECNDLWQNVEGAYPGSNPGNPCFPGRGTGDVAIDPAYRDADADDFLIAQNSPLKQLCRPTSCGSLGAGNECSTAVEETTWGGVKALYRD